MLETLRRKRDNEEGFTLIELMVVVLIIGILLAIAVPTFLSAQKNAKAKAATSNLRQGLSAVKTVYAEKQDYSSTSITTTSLRDAEPSLTWQTTASDSPEKIMFVSDADTIALATRAKTGFCYYIEDDVSTAAGGTKFGKATATAATCTPVLGSTATAASPEAAGW